MSSELEFRCFYSYWYVTSVHHLKHLEYVHVRTFPVLSSAKTFKSMTFYEQSNLF